MTGNNGLFARAKEAREETLVAQEDELRRLTQLEAAANLENYPYTDENGDTATIPAGFAVSQVEGENTIQSGLVIIDKDGNEFVWIPVLDEKQYIRNTSFKNVDISTNSLEPIGYLPNGIDNEKNAVINAGGFYIARFETGQQDGRPVSKQKVSVWTNISFDEALEEAKNLINTSYAKSAMCSGIQWDIMMNFINEKFDGNGNVYNVTISDNSRHIGTLEECGNNIADKICNIYDLEGNAWDYIAEKNTYSSSSPYNRRGGYYNGTNSASERRSSNGEGSDSRGFRCVLYLL